MDCVRFRYSVRHSNRTCFEGDIMRNSTVKEQKSHGSLLVRHLDEVTQAISTVGRKRALSPEDRDELRSFAMEKLLEREEKVFGTLDRVICHRAYFIKVVERLWIDLTYARWGRWRPTAKARRLGETAIELDRLVRRDGLQPSVAAKMVGQVRTHRHTSTLRDLACELLAGRSKAKERAVPVPLDGLEVALPTFDNQEEEERRLRARELLKVLRKTLGDLSPEDRRLIRLRFMENLSGPEIARQTRLGQSEVYRRLKTILGDLAKRLKGRGLGRQRVVEAADSAGLVIIPRGALDGVLASAWSQR